MKKLFTSLVLASALSFAFACGATERKSNPVSLIHPSSSSQISQQNSTTTESDTQSSSLSSDEQSNTISSIISSSEISSSLSESISSSESSNENLSSSLTSSESSNESLSESSNSSLDSSVVSSSTISSSSQNVSTSTQESISSSAIENSSSHSSSTSSSSAIVTCTDIQLDNLKTSFTNGENFSVGNLVVTAIMSNNTTKTLQENEYIVDSSSFDSYVAGTYTITITAFDISKTYQVTVGQPYATDISISGYKTSFTNGEDFSVGNLVVTAIMSNNTTKTLQENEYYVDDSSFESYMAGTYTITVTAFGLSETYQVTVGEPYATDISLFGYKTSFTNGEDFSVGNLAAIAFMSNGDTISINPNDYTIDSSNYNKNVAGSYVITVTALGITKTYEVTVGEVFATDVTISGYTTSFENGTNFSKGNLVVTASYSNGTTRELTATEYTVDSSEYNKNVAGSYVITVTALGFSKTYSVTVGEVFATNVTLSGYTTSFENGTNFSAGNLVVTASYSNSTSKNLTTNEYTIDSSNYNKNVAGTYTITVTALGFTKTYTVTVGAVFATDITLSGYTTSFENGTNFSKGNLVVTASYSNSTTKALTTSEYTLDSSQYNKNVEGTYTITVTALGFTKTYTVTVGAVFAKSIAISGQKTSFLNDDAFSTGSLVVTATYSNSTTKTLTASEYTVDSSAYKQYTAGSYTIKVTALGFSKTYTATVGAVYAKSIAISGQKTSFLNDDAFSTGSLVVTATYSDKTTKNLSTSEYTVDSSSYKQYTQGSYTIKVSALGFSKTYTVTVGAVYAKSIALSGQKTSFKNDDAFSTSGLVVTATYSDKTTKNLSTSEYTVDSSAYKQYTAGSYTIKVSALGFSKTYTATVGAVYAKSIALSGQKTSFKNDDAFSTGSLVVTATYSDKSTKNLSTSEYTVNSSAYKQYTAGSYTITVTALGLSKTYTATVGAVYTKSVAVSGQKTSFMYNEAFSTGSIVVTATMSNKSTKTIASGSYTVDSSAYKKATAGTYSIKVTYDSVSTTYSVTVDKDYTFTVANISVNYKGTATISPKFTVTANAITVTYSITSGSGNITISGSTITGAKASTTATVKATTSKGTSATFTVTVGADYTFTVGNITTYKGFYEIPTPKFTVSGNAQSVTYSTTSSNVTISGNKITGAKANTTATVTATSAKGTTASFTVTVGKDEFFNNIFNNANFLSYLNTLQTNLTNKTGINKNDLTLYIGDSFFDYRNFFTQAFNAMYTGANADTWGISSSMADQWIYFIQKVYQYNPKRLVVHIGTNDIFDRYGSSGKNLLASATQGSTNYNTIVNNVTAVLKDLFNKIHTNLPNTTVYWYSIEPRIGSGDTNGNAIAVAVNSNIKTFANSNSSWLKYLDSYTIFKADTSLYHDTVHPNFTGYVKMTELLPTSAVTSYTSYSGTMADFTHTNSTFGNSKAIVGSYGNFVYSTNVTVNSTTKNNAHITINFNHNSSYRFLLWDNKNENKLWIGGIFNGGGTINSGSNAKSYIDISSLPASFKLTILSKDANQYLFINDNLAASYSNGFTPRCLTVGAEGCGVTFTGNTIAHSGNSTYTTYANKISSATGTFTAYSIANVNVPASTVATITTTQSDTAGSKSTTIVGTASAFLFSGTLTISSIGSNAHVSLSVGSDHSSSHRFLIWDQNSDGVFHFGHGPAYTSTSKAFFNFNTKKSLKISVLSTTKHAYLFVDGSLQTVFAGKGNAKLLYATEAMATTLSNGAIYNSSSDRYKKYLNSVSSYESGSYTAGSAIDVGGSVIVDGITMNNFAQSSGNSVNNGVLQQFDAPHFVYESSITINSSSSNAHISISFDGTSANRFLIWDDNSDKTFNYGGAYSGTHKNGSGGSNATSFTLGIYVYNNLAYMFINGSLKTVLVFNFNVCGFLIGAENCNVSFNSNKIYTSTQNAASYNAYASKSGVSTYTSKAVGLYDHTNGGAKLV